MMRTTLVFGLMLLLIINVSAQEYKSLRFGMGGGNFSSRNGFPGVLIYFEPSYRLGDRFVVGFRIEGISQIGSSIGGGDNAIPNMGSYTLNGQYYLLSKGTIRPFVGLGFGVFQPNRGIFNCSCGSDSKNTTVLGFYPRIGFDFKHMVLSLDYNAVQRVKQTVYYDPPIHNGPNYYYSKTSYLALRFGVFIGGGKKKTQMSD